MKIVLKNFKKEKITIEVEPADTVSVGVFEQQCDMVG